MTPTPGAERVPDQTPAPADAVTMPLTPAQLLALPDRALAGVFQQACQSAEATQQAVLAAILAQSADTEWGRQYGFGALHSVQDFQRTVPISHWADYEASSDRMADGAADVLFPGRARHFIISSGTSGNRAKRIPESEAGDHAKLVVTRLRLMHIVRHFPELVRGGSFFPLTNSTPLGHTSAGIPCGYASGFTLSQSLGSTQGIRLAFPPAVAGLPDPAQRDYLLMRFAVQGADVAVVAGNNAGRFAELAALVQRRSTEIIADIRHGTLFGRPAADSPVATLACAPDPQRADALQALVERHGTLLPRDYWPGLRLALFWLSSSVGQYLRDVRPLLPPDCRFFDVGYGASEGKFNIPFAPGRASGVLSLCTAFYEFLPLEGGPPLLAHELQDQQSYELLLTSWSGLYRYNLQDIVRVDGFTGTAPNMVFESKSGEILNITEERIPAALVSELLRSAAAQQGVDIVQVQVFPDEDLRHYECFVEPHPAAPALDTERLADELHRLLGAQHQLYQLLCVQQQLMKPPRVALMRAGWQQHLYAQRVGSSASTTQVKIPVMVRQRPPSEWFATE